MVNNNLKSLLLILVLFSFSTLYSQTDLTKQDSSFNKYKSDKKLLQLDNMLKSLDAEEIDTLKYVLSYSNLFLDSSKYIYELELLLENDKKYIEGISILDEICEHQKRRELLLKTIREFHKAQPDYYLGKISEYLGISNKLTTVILAILSL